jgi:hypothetical protein
MALRATCNGSVVSVGAQRQPWVSLVVPLIVWAGCAGRLPSPRVLVARKTLNGEAV